MNIEEGGRGSSFTMGFLSTDYQRFLILLLELLSSSAS